MSRAANVPILTFSNDASLAGGGTYVLGFQVDQSVERVVSFAQGRGVDRFAALVPAGAWVKRPATAAAPTYTGWAPKETAVARSEEHTSELQSLMRISYAVFCLKNKRAHQK